MNTCILCGGHGASNEDALPTWVNDMLKRMGDGSFATVRDGVMSNPTRRPRRFITRRPCVKCNGWMGATFENDAAPLLKPMMEHAQEQTLTPHDQEVIARWAVKTAMMLRLTHRSRPPYPAETYRQLRQSGGKIGADWSVWIGAQTYYRKRAALANLKPTPIPSIPKTYAPYYDGHTYAVGHLVLQVLYKRGREDRALNNGAELRGVVHRIWPISLSPVTWPPKYVLTADDVAQLGMSIVATAETAPHRGSPPGCAGLSSGPDPTSTMKG